MATDDDFVPGPGPAPEPTPLGSGRSDGGQMDHQRSIPNVGVPSCDRDVVLLAGLADSLVDFRSEAIGMLARQAQGQEDRRWFCGHAGKVAEVHADEFFPDGQRTAFLENKVGPLAERIGRHDPIGPIGSHQGAVVADSKFDFGQAHRALLGPSDKAVFHGS